MKDNIKPEHYRKGEIDLFESWYRTRPFNEFRAIMESVAERYMKRDKENRILDLDKAMETLKRLKEYEEREMEKVHDKGILLADNEPYNKDIGLLRALQRSGYKYLTRNRRGDFRVHTYLPLRIGNYWVSIGYFDIGYNIKLTQVDWAENKLIEIAELLATFENGGENGK